MPDGQINMDSIASLLSNPSIQRALSNFSGFQGTVTPKPKNIYSHTPVYSKKFEIGKDENKGVFSTIKVWAHEPTFEFPKHGVFLSLNNNHSAYFKFQSLDELSGLIAWLNQVHSELMNITPGLLDKEKVVQNAKQSYDSVLSQGEN